MALPDWIKPVAKSNMPDWITPVEKPESFGTEALNAINQAGGTAARAIGYGAADIANPVIDLGNQLYKGAAEQAGMNPDQAQQNPQWDASKLPMPGVSQQRQSELDPIARGAATAAEWAPAAVGGVKLGQLGILGTKEGMKLLQRKLGIAASQKANSFVDELLQGNSVSKATQPVADEIRGKFNSAQTDFSNRYTGIKSDAANAGYSPTVTKQFPGISVASDEKSIATSGLDNALDKIDLSKHSNDIKDSINAFKENPSFEKAHELQSDLGREGDKLRSNKEGDNRKLGGELLNLRSAVKGDISDTLTKNGDTDLLNKYNATGQDYKKIVAPYLSNTTLRNIVLKKGASQINPSTIANLLSKNDAATSAIREGLSDNSKNLLLGSQLKSAIQALPKKGVFQRETDAKNLVNEYGNLDNKGLDFLRTPQSRAKIESIMGDLKRQKVLKYAAGIGIPLIAGAEGARRIF